MKYRGSLVICQFAKSRIFEQANRQMKKAMPCKWKMRENTSDLLHCTFDIDFTLIWNAIYILKLGGVSWLVTNQNSWISYLIQAQHSSSPCQCSILQKNNFLIPFKIKHRWKKNGAHMPRNTIKTCCKNSIVIHGDMCYP